LFGEVRLGKDDFDILEDNREASNPVKPSSLASLSIRLDDSLVRDVPVNHSSTHKFLPNLVGKLDGLDKIAYTEAKAYGDNERSTAILVNKEVE
jgi:hypothetical protein